MRRKILLIKLWAIGEVALSTPCISKVKRVFPESDIYFLVGNNAKDIIIGNPNIKKVISVDESIFLKPDLLKLIKLITNLRRQRFDITIIFHYSIFFSSFAFLIDSPKRIGLKRPGDWSFNTSNSVSRGASMSKIFENLKVLELLSASSTDMDVKIAIYPTKEDNARIKLLMEKNDLEPKRFILLSPTGGENPAATKLKSNIKNKIWPLEYYKELCKLILKNSNFQVVITGSRTERERAVYIKDTTNGRIVDLIEKINLRELTLLAERSALSVTNDSGPMLVLSSSISPVIAIFGPTDHIKVCPPSRNIIVMTAKLDCSPCVDESVFPNRIKDCQNPICMKRITPEMVFQKICDILKLGDKKFP